MNNKDLFTVQILSSKVNLLGCIPACPNAWKHTGGERHMLRTILLVSEKKHWTTVFILLLCFLCQGFNADGMLKCIEGTYYSDSGVSSNDSDVFHGGILQFADSGKNKLQKFLIELWIQIFDCS